MVLEEQVVVVVRGGGGGGGGGEFGGVHVLSLGECMYYYTLGVIAEGHVLAKGYLKQGLSFRHNCYPSALGNTRTYHSAGVGRLLDVHAGSMYLPCEGGE
jgi:hypothetical protein